ncbi:MAG: Planctomycete cytochrome [Verrucomicrobiales bacterium]|nr:Planctomycete cytochrome [Verrucomicrobiales bacterium]
MSRSAILSLVLVGASSLSAAVDFGREVQPLFARHCYECHGAQKQKGKLRLDQRSSALRVEEAVIFPGKPAESELYRRVTLPKGHEEIMPNRGEPLNKAETELLRDWIAQGAAWPDNVVSAKHWAYVKPVRPTVPETKNRTWAENEIDQFVLARLDKETLHPSPEADRATLLRRVSLDLIGLPPSPAEARAFLADKSSDAYEKLVDRLLNSPQYGERWARPWLDLARYADSSGYQRDNLWDIWPYRDWVINALNHDMPFDQFTIEQIAGDLLPDATAEQKVATGFNRCVPTNVEAGSDQEETRVNQIIDRVNTLGSVWLGSTLGCAQCHNHKYDPISQKEYYQLFAFFNNTAKETDKRTPNATAALKFSGPYLNLPDTQNEPRRNELQKQIDDLTQRIDSRSEELQKSQPSWEEKVRTRGLQSGQVQALDITDFDAESGSSHRILEDKSVLLIKDENDATPPRDTYTVTVQSRIVGITAFKLEVLTDPSLPGGGPGRGDEKNPNFVLNEFVVTMAPAAATNAGSKIKFRKATASFSQSKFQVGGAIDDNPRSGWAVRPEFSKNHWAIFETERPVGSAEGSTFTFRLEQNNGAGRTIGRLRLSAITGTVNTNAIPLDIVEIVRQSPTDRPPVRQQRLKNYYLSIDSSLEKWRSERSKLQNEIKGFKSPRTLVMQEMSETRKSTVFTRGDFLQPGEPVQSGTPAVLHSLNDGPPNRLTLARWLVDTNNPLMARVTVNRWWAEFFGHGLVATSEDFGIKGDLPTHPELLDWLACEFPKNGWSMKKMHRLIVTSATYRQSSVVTPELLEKDDQNKLYARGPRFRMDAEMIRDNALAVSGLLSLKQGGPPIHPYQPAGIWESKVGGDAITYDISEGEDRYRRGIYIVWKRTSPYPSFINFDATDRNACTIKRSRSNTPLQALTLLNDPVYVEAAAALARRILAEQPSASVEERIQNAFLLCLARIPSAKELNILKKLYDEQLSAAKSNPDSARKTLADFKVPAQTSLPEFSAWHAVAWALLNLNETITKG